MNKIIENNKEQNVELLKPKIDIVFQSLFNQANSKITKAFVEALIDEKIDKMIINNDKELIRENPDDKLGILDLQLDINDNEKIDVEIQLAKKEDFIKRIIFYLSKIYALQVKRGKMYKDAKRVVIIAIVDFRINLVQDLKDIETIWNLREKNHPDKQLTNLLEICIIELEKVKEFYQKNKHDEKAQWMLFLDNPNSVEVQDIMKRNEEIKEATILVKKMSQDEKMQRLADLREKAIMDEKESYNTGKNDGEKIGEEKSKKEMANKMLELGIDVNIILKVTGLNKQEIENLQKRSK